MHIYKYVLFSAKSKNLDLGITMSKLRNKTSFTKLSARCSKHIELISRRVLAFWGSYILRDFTVTNCRTKAMKQRDDFITILLICKWGRGALTINQLHITGPSTAWPLASISKGKPSASISISIFFYFTCQGLVKLMCM